MCLIAYRPSGAGTIPDAVIQTATLRHPDGFGVMWRDSDGLRTETWAPADKPAFLARLDRLNAAEVELAVHFRFATSGPKDALMAHPYTYEDPDPSVGTVGIVHNGIIGIAHDRSVESDTSAFVRLVLARLPSRWWADDALTYLVGEAIGWSKFVVMTATETVNLHEKSGDWDGGVWYSSAYKPLSSYGYTPKAHTPPNPMSKRSAKRAAAAARRAAGKPGKVPAVTSEDAFLPEYGMRSGLGGFPSLQHDGHRLEAINPVDLTRDNDYVNGVRCSECDTIGDLYVIEGVCYADMKHLEPTGLQLAVQVNV